MTRESVKKTRRRAGVLITAGATVMMLAACAGGNGGTGGETPDAGAEVDPRSPEVSEFVVAGYPFGDFATIPAAARIGAEEEYGISMTLQPAANSPAMLAQLVSGDVPIAMVNGFFSVPAVLEGADLVVVGELIRGVPEAQTVEVLPDSGIKTPADLEGKKVGVVGLQSGHQARIEKAVIEDGGDPSKVEFVNLSWNEMPPALEQGNVDAVTVTSVSQYNTRLLGTEPILDLGDGMFAEFPDAQWLANGAWARENPNTVAAFQCAAVIKGAEAINEDAALYETILREDFDYSDDAVDAAIKLIHPAANEPVQVIPDLMFELGWIDAEFDISEITLPLPDNC